MAEDGDARLVPQGAQFDEQALPVARETTLLCAPLPAARIGERISV